MQFVPVAGTASVELIYDAMGNKCENVLHFKASSTPINEAALTQLAEAVFTWYSTTGKVLQHSSVSLSAIVCKDLTSATGPAIEYSVGLPIAGTNPSGTALPLNVTAVVSFGTALRGRSYRGRLYAIGLVTGNATGNTLDTGYRTALVNAYAGLNTAAGTEGWNQVVVSKFTNKAPRTAGVATPVSSVSVDANVDSQRRRLNGRGQ
jgi:hypothetical protein